MNTKQVYVLINNVTVSAFTTIKAVADETGFNKEIISDHLKKNGLYKRKGYIIASCLLQKSAKRARISRNIMHNLRNNTDLNTL